MDSAAMKTLILICALGTFRQDCSIEAATVVVQGPEATNLAQCGFLGQAYLADTTLAGYVEDGHYLKILCSSDDRLDLAQRNPSLHAEFVPKPPIYDEVTTNTIAEVFSWTLLHSGYDKPEQPPIVEFRSNAFFVEHVCFSEDNCAAKGVYRDGNDIIMLHESYRDLSNVHAQAMLVHESVHFLQSRSHEWSEASCSSRVKRERDAYLLQRRFLIAEGGFPPYAVRLPTVSESACPSQ